MRQVCSSPSPVADQPTNTQMGKVVCTEDGEKRLRPAACSYRNIFRNSSAFAITAVKGAAPLHQDHVLAQINGISTVVMLNSTDM